MKKALLSTIFAGMLLFVSGCVDLNLNPLTEGSTENWFSNSQEIEMALNELYGTNYWYFDSYRMYNSDRWTDDWNQREYVYDYLKGEVSSTWGDTEAHYKRFYQAVARANTILASVERASDILTEEQVDQYRGEAAFFRAVAYSYLTFLYGDVPFYTEYITLDEAYKMAKTPKATVLEQVYKDFDTAIEYLPDSYSGVKRITKGAAYAFKARTALWNSDWSVCKAAAEGCIATGEFALESDYSTLFLPETKKTRENIFYLVRDESLGLVSPSLKSFLPRSVGANATAQPSIELMCAYLCTDGKTIDKSPLYNPLKPFENRDPRLSATILEPGGTLMGYTIDPRPWVKTVTNDLGQSIKNKDNRTVDQYAAYNGLTLKKGVSEDWLVDFKNQANIVVMRYADVLLMLAEAKCELGEVDEEAQKAINMVRARAYGVDYRMTSKYPAVKTTDQAEFRTDVRIERRMEFAWENHRFFDLIRWRVAEKACNKPMVGLSIDKLKAADETNWFFPTDVIPTVDENGTVDLENTILGKNCFVQIAFGTFDAGKQYLFPFPADEMTICPNLVQNDGY
ncbi:MAG: RagB/SusD family nutrient uptake outer membrane protein [Bacteroidales bacterium]|nr:RagB/SusD family nutrient uptake outer membrane protein [Bacteroidales bacterium]MCI2144851.1 RagB/SusD family nutrient uptake outer membrane protein [Bacteroidales bacterium]